ncbi:MAG: hypothetical protein L3J44_02750 [Campylobacteraceae bacterium]|nr:hypothetical protein [Campylobacteraceae bacterium]
MTTNLRFLRIISLFLTVFFLSCKNPVIENSGTIFKDVKNLSAKLFKIERNKNFTKLTIFDEEGNLKNAYFLIEKEKEIPENGVCHCGIFCTPEFATNKKIEMGVKKVITTHSHGLTQKEAQTLVDKNELDGDEILSLLEARELNMINFKLVDVREHMEWKMGHIKGTNKLIPTSSFFRALDSEKLNKDENIILYCHVGSRSAYCAKILLESGFSKIGNLTNGIVSYNGEIKRQKGK